MVKIAYGEADFKTVRDGNYFYQDRTQYIHLLENAGAKYLMYLRPRRFGKSLFTSMLRYYYGIQYQNEFQSLFGKLNIGQQPTNDANQYMILHFDFSSINTSSEESTYTGFVNRVKEGIEIFFTTYPKAFSKEFQKKVLDNTEPNELIGALFTGHLTNHLKNPIYVLIDEYDHFANELISFNYQYFGKAVSENGFVRKFYEMIKRATWQGIVQRIFITGVSPLTMDSMTSGFNISTNISLELPFHNMMGFKHEEVRGLLAQIQIPENQLDTMMTTMQLWYNGYCFESDCPDRLYNPNMVLYFARAYQSAGNYPKEWLDPNIASDYVKIRNLFNIQNGNERFATVLNALQQTGQVSSSLIQQFSLERSFNQQDLVSLLFYMGFLTIQDEDLGGYVFRFPNYVIKKLYSSYFVDVLAQLTDLVIDNFDLDDAIKRIAREGNIHPFLEKVQAIVKRMSPKDSGHFNENSLKSIIISLLHQQKFYYVHTEYETDWQFMDVFLEAIRGYKVTFDVALELKYVKKAGKVAVNTLFRDATNQLKTYLATDKFNQRTNVKSWVVVLAGDQLQWKLVT